MAASVIFMAINNCLTNKTFGCSNVLKSWCQFQKQVSLREKACHLKLADICLQVMKSINQYALSYLTFNL